MMSLFYEMKKGKVIVASIGDEVYAQDIAPISLVDIQGRS